MLISKTPSISSVDMNLRIITKNHEADPEIVFLTKSISKPYGRATALPPAWELSDNIEILLLFLDMIMFKNRL